MYCRELLTHKITTLLPENDCNTEGIFNRATPAETRDFGFCGLVGRVHLIGCQRVLRTYSDPDLHGLRRICNISAL